MKAILIDDENPALLQMERLLLADGRLEVRGKFTSLADGLRHIGGEKTDVVFLDIEMPEVNGLEASELIHQLDSDITIVFVTAFSEYAVEAFELQAFDYLLKPVYPARLAKTISRIAAGYARGKEITEPPVQGGETQILCLGRLMLRSAPDVLETFKWRTLKTQELFAYLLHHKGKWLDKNHIIETLWSDYPQEKGINHLHTSIYQVRKLLSNWKPSIKVEFDRNSYRLSMESHIMIDAEFLEQVTEQPVITKQNLKYYEDLLSLYRGDFLEELDCFWAVARRERLRRLYTQLVMTVVSFELANGRDLKAITRLSGLQEREPYSDEICRAMLIAYGNLRDLAALQRYYETFEALIRNELKIEPAVQTKELYEQIQKRLN